MKERHFDEDAYLDEIYSDDDSDRVEAHLQELSYQDMSGGFTDDELTYMLSDESRFSWLLRSDFQTIRAWLDTGKAIYAPPAPGTRPTSTQHTLGPWTVKPDSNLAHAHPYHRARLVTTADFDEEAHTGDIICRMSDAPNQAANSRLVAASPDLYVALTEALRVIVGLTPHTPTIETIMLIRQALDKAMPERD